MSAVEFTRWFLAFFFGGVAVFYTVRILVVSRRWQTSPVFVGDPGTPQFITHLAFRVFRVAILGVCVARLVWPGLDPYLGAFDVLWHPAVLMLGNALLVAGFSILLVFHFYMGEAWRSGTRGDERTRLVTSGPFAVSRNPMMICVLAGQLGFFLALPSVFSLVCLVIGAWAVIAQVGIEEQVLRRRFGAEYDSYVERTPRWLVLR